MNVKFSATCIEDFIIHYSNDCAFAKLRELAKQHIVPSLDVAAAAAVTNLVSIKKPKKSIEIGSGIGVSTLAIINGFADTELICLDANLERHLIHEEYFKEYKNIKTYQMRAEVFLDTTEEKFDFAFVDSVKREYGIIFQKLKKHLNDGALVVFDDILIYGFIAAEESETPYKYQQNRREILSFLDELKDDKKIKTQIIPVSGGLLVLSI